MECNNAPQLGTSENSYTASKEPPPSMEDTFISPYNSPQRDCFSYDPKGAGDFSSEPLFADVENDHSMANKNHSVTSHMQGKGPTSIESNILKDIQKASPHAEKSCGMSGDAPLTTHVQSDSGVELVDDKMQEDHSLNDASAEVEERQEIGTDVDALPWEVTEGSPSPEGEKDKIFAEMLASAAGSTPNDELSHSEMLNEHKRMEEEFRSMVIEEQQKRKLLIEGASHVVKNSELSDSVANLASKQSAKPSTETSAKVPKEAKVTPPSRLPTTQTRASGIARPVFSRTAVKSTLSSSTEKQSSPSSTKLRTVTPVKLRSTPTTIRVSSRFNSAGEKRTPLQPTSLRVRSSLRNNTSAGTPQSDSPQKATQPIPHKSPRSVPLSRTPLSTTPRRTHTLSSQSSENERPRMPGARNVQSKIGSLQNSRHTPGGGKVKIESKRADYSQVQSKVGSKANLGHTPSGGKVKIESKKLDYSSVQSRCGSFDNARHTPGGGKIKIENRKADFSHVSSKCGSFDNVTHTPGGGRVKVETKKLDFGDVTSRCGSLDNVKHTPQGGKVKIFHGRIDTSKVQPKVGSRDNLLHTPGGGNVKIENRSLDLSHVKSKCGSMENAKHVAGGGDVQIFHEAPAFKENAKSRIGSLENAGHVPGGGDIKIYDEKLQFREFAAPRTDTGFNGTASLGSSGSVSSM